MTTVLIVDDAAFMRMMITNILKDTEFQVIGEASNGIKGVEQYKQLKPDIVTMDITMPELDGIETVKLIKSYDTNAQIVMCSAMGQQSMVIDAIKAGAKDFIVKPFEKDKVIETLLKFKK